MITYIRGKDFEEFVTWLAGQFDKPEFDRGNPFPVDASKRILDRWELVIAKKVMQEAANIARTAQLRSDSTEMKEAIVAALEKRSQEL